MQFFLTLTFKDLEQNVLSNNLFSLFFLFRFLTKGIEEDWYILQISYKLNSTLS